MADNPGEVKHRNARACEACRVSKSRCIFKEEQNICQRCEQNGSQCLVRTKARPRRVRAGVRVQPADETSKTRSQGTGSPEFGINLPSVVGPETHHDVSVLKSHHHHALGGVDDPEDFESPEYFQNPSTSSSTSHFQTSPIPKQPVMLQPRRISLGEASQLLSLFRNRANFFPFVVIPADATVQSLARTSPFLLLTLLTIAAIPDPQLHHQLDHEFRRVLSMKVVVEGRKSLDYLQGLLVYVAWYPFHTKPKNNQAFTYMNLATSLSSDLGLDREFPSQDSLISDIPTTGLVDGYSFTKAAKRAYIGCWYLSSALSQGFHKPNNFQHTPLMTTHLHSLSIDEIPSDLALVALFKLEHISERINKSNSATKPPVFDPEVMTYNFDMNAQIFQNELQNFRADTPAHILNLPFISLTLHFLSLTIYSHELGSLRRPYLHTQHLLTHPPPNSTSSPTHPQKCLNTTKSYFANLLSIPPALYHSFTSILWGHMIQAILILSRLTFLMAANGNWDAEVTRQNCPLGVYLDCLCYRMGCLSVTANATTTPNTREEEGGGGPDVMHIFALILSSVKTSYEKRVSHIQPNVPFFFVENGVAVGAARGHCPMRDPELEGWFERFERGGDVGFGGAGGGGGVGGGGVGGGGVGGGGVGGGGDVGGEEGGMGWNGNGNGGGNGGGDGNMGWDYGNGNGNGNVSLLDGLWVTLTSNWAEEF